MKVASDSDSDDESSDLIYEEQKESSDSIYEEQKESDYRIKQNKQKKKCTRSKSLPSISVLKKISAYQ